MVMIWKDIVEDYLETGMLWDRPTRDPLLCELAGQGIEADTVDLPACFKIGSHFAIISELPEMSWVWFYNPRTKEIRKMKVGPFKV